MKNEQSCVCGNNLEFNPYSVNFNSGLCSVCCSTHFVALSDAQAANFTYDSSDSKYGDPSYLDGGQLRWSHEVILNRLHGSGRKSLEIGCFNGFFVAQMQFSGIDAYGFDLNSKAIARGRSNYKLQDRLFDDLATAYEKGPFDDIIMIDVLEHMADANSFIDKALLHLGDAGRLIVAGPIADRYFLDKTDFPPHHLWRFTKQGLSLAAERRDLDAENWGVQYDFSLFLRNVLGRLLNGMRKREYFGEGPSFTDDRIPKLVLSSLSFLKRITSPILRFFDLPYCSAVVTMQRIEKIQNL